jgi:hypothetical protein
VNRFPRRRALRLGLGLAPVLLVARWPRPAHAQSVTAATAPRYFRVESQPGTDRQGRPTVWGYVYLHTKGQGSARVQILIESLDAAGQPIAREIAHVDDEVPLYNRAYFEIRPQTPAPAYRVTVYSADWGKTGGM